jgi:hypothetical protein
VRQAELDAGERYDVLMSEELAELRCLRHEIKIVRDQLQRW